MLKWIRSYEKKPEKVFVVHGESDVTDLFTNTLREELDLNADAPYSGAIFDLKNNLWIEEGKMIEVQAKPKQKKGFTVFERLVNAGRRLMVVIQHNEGGANKDLAKFTSQIEALCDKWDR